MKLNAVEKNKALVVDYLGIKRLKNKTTQREFDKVVLVSGDLFVDIPTFQLKDVDDMLDTDDIVDSIKAHKLTFKAFDKKDENGNVKYSYARFYLDGKRWNSNKRVFE